MAPFLSVSIDYIICFNSNKDVFYLWFYKAWVSYSTVINPSLLLSICLKSKPS